MSPDLLEAMSMFLRALLPVRTYVRHLSSCPSSACLSACLSVSVCLSVCCRCVLTYVHKKCSSAVDVGRGIPATPAKVIGQCHAMVLSLKAHLCLPLLCGQHQQYGQSCQVDSLGQSCHVPCSIPIIFTTTQPQWCSSSNSNISRTDKLKTTECSCVCLDRAWS